MKKITVGIIIILGFLLGMLSFTIWDKNPSFVKPVLWSSETQWIAFPEPTHRLYARYTFNLPQREVKTAWLKFSADNNFLIYLNGKPMARQLSQSTSSLPFAARRMGSLRSQYINDSLSYQVKSENRQIAYPRNWKLTYYLDISANLRAGKNVIAIAVEKARQDPRVVIEGKINLFDLDTSGIDLSTGVVPWKVNNLFDNNRNILWYEKDFPDQNWQEAKAIGAVTESTRSTLSQHLYDLPLQGSWITGQQTPKGEVWLRSKWQVSNQMERAFIRFGGEGEKSIIINGKFVNYFPRERPVLHMNEVTNLLHPGVNTIAIRLANALESSLQMAPNLFYLDGWVETKQKQVTDIFATDSNWISLNQPGENWTTASETGEPAFLLQKPTSRDFIWRFFEGDAYLNNYPDYFRGFMVWGLIGTTVSLVSAWLLGRFWLNNLEYKGDSLTKGAILLVPGTFFLIGVGLLKHRYAESERGILFAQSQTNTLILLGFVAILLLTLLWHQLSRDQQPSLFSRWNMWFFWGVTLVLIVAIAVKMGVSGSFFLLLLCLALATISTLPILWRFQPLRWQQWSETLLRIWNSWGSWFLFSLIIFLALCLRIYDLDGTPRDSDESTSLDAIRGILKTGAPTLTSGVWYTRGPFFHYLLAFWFNIVGFSTVKGRFLIAIFGTLTLVLVFFISRKITGNTGIALIVIALLAIDPWELAISRNTRFYQVLQLTTNLSLWFFYKGFIEQEKKIYQYLFLVSMTLSLLTQEGVGFIQIPIFILGFLYFYRPFRWSEDWRMVLTSMFLFSIYMFGLTFFNIKCRSVPLGISSGTAAPISLNFFDLTGFPKGFFIGNSRFYVIYSLFFILGFIYFLPKRNGKLMFFFSSILVFLADATLLLLQVSPRYTYPFYPIFVMLAVYSAFSILKSLGRKLESILKESLPMTAIAIACFGLIFFFNIEPERVIASYQDILARNNPALFEYIRQNIQPGDLVMANLPTGSAMALNKLDYHVPRRESLSLDGYYRRDGIIAERWAGGVVITNVDQLIPVLAKGKRIWIQLDDAQPPKSPNRLKIYNYMNTLGKTVFQSYGVTLRLWQPEDGYLPEQPYEGQDLGAF